MNWKRREVLQLLGAAGLDHAAQGVARASGLGGSSIPATGSVTPILDTHIHLFDPTRPGGVPWPKPDDPVIYKPALPARYERIARPFGVVGAIAVEASPLLRDNDWVLGVAAHNPFIVGFIGDLVPGNTSFTADLDRLHANPLFLGIRYGNLWDRDLAVDIVKPGFLDGLKALAEAGLVLETANPDPSLIAAIAKVGDSVPGLRIVIDHLPHAVLPLDVAARRSYDAELAHLGKRPGTYVKLSEVSVLQEGKLVRDGAFYKPGLDAIWEAFGEDRVMFGSDWPNSDHLASYGETLAIVRDYITQKGETAQQKYFWENSVKAYRWKPRTPQQNLKSSM